MATYPTTFKISPEESMIQDLSKLELDTWPNGAVRARSFDSTTRYAWTLVHPRLSHAERDQLEAFWLANKLVTFDFVDRFSTGAPTRTGIIFDGTPPVYKRLKGKNTGWSATVKIRMR